MPTFAGRRSIVSSIFLVHFFPQNCMVGQHRQEISPQSFLVWKIRFKTQVSSGSDIPSEALLRIKEVEMVDSPEELKSSRSVSGGYSAELHGRTAQTGNIPPNHF